MTIYEDEVGPDGQLKLSGICAPPILAERAFLRLARQWRTELPDEPDAVTSRSTDLLALSCLQIAVDYGPQLTDNARLWMVANAMAAEQREGEAWIDALAWRLCELKCTDKNPIISYDFLTSSRAIVKQVRNLSHEDSSIRAWMMEIGWIVRRSLPSAATEELFETLATKLSGQVSTMGLAASSFSDETLFWRVANEFYDPPPEFEAQYRDRLALLKEIGVLRMQAPFWKLEAECRAIIEKTVLSQHFIRQD